MACRAIAALGAAWYLVATQLVIPHFNHGNQAFYLPRTSLAITAARSRASPARSRANPNRVVRDAVQHDRIVFYKKLLMLLGWMPLASPAPPADGVAANAGERDRRPGVYARQASSTSTPRS